MNLSKSIIVLGIILGGCCNKDFIIPQEVIDYDFYEAAIDLTSIMNSCSEQAVYSTIGATSDRSSGDCLDNPIANRWFKFVGTATGDFYFYVYFSGPDGTMKSAVVTLWEADGSTEVDCDASFLGVTSAYVSENVTTGEYYYVSVDVQDIDDLGTFTVCISDTD